jgi:NADH-quinone oxidoreductase subunit F
MKAKQHRQRRTDAGVTRAVAEHGGGDKALFPVLQHIQTTRGHLDNNAIGAVSDALGVSDVRTFGLASFYSMLSTEPRSRQVIRVCDGPVCCLHGGEAAQRAVELAVAGHDVRVERTSCLGLCDRAPAALVGLDPCGPLGKSSAGRILDGWRGESPSYTEPLAGEVRVAMDRNGKIDPDDIDSTIEQGAYESLKSALQREPARVVEAIAQSGLQGRGGAGFPTGRKWQFVAQADGAPKFVICNADESEPAAFKDRVLMEGDPHLLLEGMVLAAYAVGASEGYIYIRGEYEPAAKRLESAVLQAVQRGWLGQDIQDSNFSFTIRVHRGAGVYICGEETALLESLEGRRGEPRIRPPYPTSHGLFGKPTVVNNVETFCKVPAILARGPAWYRSMGTASSPGTKLFTITGNVKRPGVFEVPFGITLRQVIEQFAGGMQNGSTFKMALTGGAAGTIVGSTALSVPLDFAAYKYGVSLGSGVLLVMDESVSVLKLLGWLLHFFEMESCGKCTPCREGTQAARQIIYRLENGEARRDDIKQLTHLSKMLRLTSLCGLGQSVAWPIDSALKSFPKEFQCS